MARRLGLHAIAACCAVLVAGCHGRPLLGEAQQGGAQAVLPVVVLAQPTGAMAVEDVQSAVHGALQVRLLDEVPTFWDKVVRVTQDFCFANSEASCEVDYNGTTDWWKQYYSGLSPIATSTGHTELQLLNSPQPYQSSAHTFMCAYNPVAAQTCRLDGQSISSQSVTTTHSTTYSFQGKVGFVGSISVLGAQVSTEITFDFGYSFSDSTSNTTVEGEATMASVQVPMTPEDKRCCIINVFLQRVKQTGSMNIYVAANGSLATKQFPERHWLLDESASEAHNYRSFSFPWLLQSAKQLKQASAMEWEIEQDGTAHLNMPITLDFDVAVSGFADPQMYPLTDPRCNQS